MNTNNNIPFIRSLLDKQPETVIQEAQERFYSYVNLVNRIGTRIAQEQDQETCIDEISLSDVL
jgi:hypothetical protein